MDRQQIDTKIEKSSLRGLVPMEAYRIIGDEIEFIPSRRFFSRWRKDRNWLEAIGVRVYSRARYRKPTGLQDWRARVTINMLDTLIKCQECDTMIPSRDRYCKPCWQQVVKHLR